MDNASSGWSLSSGFTNLVDQLAWIAGRNGKRLDDYNVSDTVLGEGGYGRVLRGYQRSSGQDVAVKEIDVAKMNPAAIVREVAILRRLGQHPNIIELKGYFEQTDKHYIVMEAVTGGELFKQVETRGVLPESTAHLYFSQLAAGVLHMHSLGVAHRDLKLENALLDFTERHVKIIDFGLAHAYQPCADGRGYDVETPLRHYCGSKSYCPPEMLASVPYKGFQADLYSLGVCLFALVTGFFPLEEACPRDWRFEKVARTQLAGRSSTRRIFELYRRVCPLSTACVELLDGMIALDPRKRISLQQVLSSEWMLTGGAASSTPAAEQPQAQRSAAPAWDKSLEVDMSTLEAAQRGPTHPGMSSGMMSISYDDDDDDELVWRSLVPPTMPKIERQAAVSRIGGA